MPFPEPLEPKWLETHILNTVRTQIPKKQPTLMQFITRNDMEVQLYPGSYQEAERIKIYFCIADRATKGRNAGSHTQVEARIHAADSGRVLSKNNSMRGKDEVIKEHS